MKDCFSDCMVEFEIFTVQIPQLWQDFKTPRKKHLVVILRG